MTIVAGLLSIRLYTELAPREVLGGASLVTGASSLATRWGISPLLVGLTIVPVPHGERS